MRKFWDIIVGFLCKVPYDKLMHFCMGIIIASFFCITLGMKTCIVPVIFVGFAKEFFDIWTTKQWDWFDFLATCVGGLIIQLFAIF